jgi:choline dehydrogenase-like flavoprotein
MVLSGLRANKIVIEGGRAVGIDAAVLTREGGVAHDRTGRERQIRIRAGKVILAGGAMCTPQMLLRQKLAGRSGEVGKNLTLHPSGPCVAMFDELIEGHKFIPQTAYSHEFLKEGLMLLTANGDSHMMPGTTGLLGQRLMRVFERANHIACIGFLLAEEARGRIRVDPKGRTLMTYNLTRRDTAKIHRAHVLLAELLFAAGAKEVYPGINPGVTLFDKRGLQEFARRKLSAADFLLASYHPLGTCKMSQDPRKGVVGLDHQVHDVPGLYVVDGSTVSGPLGVNPQLSIMAFATRAAEKIGAEME